MMPETVQQLETQLSALRAARAGGVKSVSYGDRTIEYRSDRELAAAIADVEHRLTGLVGPGPTRTVYITSSKGT
ncbi:MAG: hypothetical protein AAF739_12300 [Pseudomonadota bacterium]